MGASGSKNDATRSEASASLINSRDAAGSSQKSPKKVKAVKSGEALGRQEKTLVARQAFVNRPKQYTIPKPKVDKGAVYDDTEFSRVVEPDRNYNNRSVNLTWKRPQECVETGSKPRLFGDKVNRYSVRQGQVGDCFFITSLSAIAQRKNGLKQNMPGNAYRMGRRYRGIFHCRLWYLGEWIDVYTDDRLPYDEGVQRVFGSHSKDLTVFWVSLMEKGLARLCKGYNSMGGDQAAAYVLLTGGVVEEVKVIKRQSDDIIVPKEEVFGRIQRALKSGSAALTGIDETERGSFLRGLVANHAYEITDAKQFKQGKDTVQLLKIRNPWGERNEVRLQNENGEWTGRWSYKSTEWDSVPPRIKKKYNVEYNVDGEFWVNVEDFCRIFGHIYFADTIPNFDEDGFRKKDGLNQVINILGEWHRDTAAGNDLKKKFRNPRFVLNVPSRAAIVGRDGRIPVVLQLIQQYENVVSQAKDASNQLFCRLEIFRIEKKKKERQGDSKLTLLSLTELTNPDAFVSSRFVTNRYRLLPGKYLLMPTYLDRNVRSPVSRTFCIRAFAAVSLDCSQMTQYPIAIPGKPSTSMEYLDAPPSTAVTIPGTVCPVNVFGEWKGETAAGPEDTKRMKNPKFILTVPGFGSKPTKVGFQLRHRNDVDRPPHCRLDIFKVKGDVKRNKQRWLVLHQITNSETFIGGAEATSEYDLTPGKYLLLPNCARTDNIACNFCIRILASTHLPCRRVDGQNLVTFVQKADDKLKIGAQQTELDRTAFVLGEWVRETTAGGQISHQTYYQNPQYELTVSGRDKQSLLVDLLQETKDPTPAIGYRIYKVTKDQKIPSTRDALQDKEQMTSVQGRPHPLTVSTESNDYHQLDPGRYVILVYADKPTDEKKFALLIAFNKNSGIKLTGR